MYLRALRVSRRAVRQVLTMQSALESCLTLKAVVNRFWSCWQAWMGLDPKLTACGPITPAEFDTFAGKAAANECFKRVGKPISSIQCKLLNSKCAWLPYGIGFRKDDDGCKDDINKCWQSIKNEWGLRTPAARNYVVHLDVQFFDKRGWDWFKKDFLKGVYHEQLDLVCSKEVFEYLPNAQDGYVGSRGFIETHLKKNTLFCDSLLPRGFSLTHVYVEAMPGDGAPFQVEAGGDDEQKFGTGLKDLKRI